MFFVSMLPYLLVIDQTNPAIFMLTARAFHVIAPRHFLAYGLALWAILTVGAQEALRLGVLNGAFSIGGNGLDAGEGGVIDYNPSKLAC